VKQTYEPWRAEQVTALSLVAQVRGAAWVLWHHRLGSVCYVARKQYMDAAQFVYVNEKYANPITLRTSTGVSEAAEKARHSRACVCF